MSVTIVQQLNIMQKYISENNYGRAQFQHTCNKVLYISNMMSLRLLGHPFVGPTIVDWGSWMRGCCR